MKLMSARDMAKVFFIRLGQSTHWAGFWGWVRTKNLQLPICVASSTLIAMMVWFLVQ